MDAFIGTVMQFAGTYAPIGWMLCDGSTLDIEHYEALFSILGINYGGDGVHNFKIPNLNPPKNQIPYGPIYIICVEGEYPSRP